MYWSLVLLSLVPAQPAPDARHSPAEIFALALDDARTVPLSQRYYVRYLSLANVPVKERAELAKTIAGHVNGLSTEAELVAPVVVAGGLLLRVNVQDYGGGWAREWERLFDPLVYVKTVKVDTHGNKRQVEAFAAQVADTPAKRAVLDELKKLTHSDAPVIHAAWWLNETAIHEDRKTGYYRFLGIRNQTDYFKVARFDAKLVQDRTHRRITLTSGITLQPRRLDATRSVFGPGWESFDNDRAQGEANPAVVLNGGFNFKATEKIFILPNRFPVFLLADDKGVLQGKAPDGIVGGDRLSPNNDTRLHVNLSCWRCHCLGKEERMVKAIAELRPDRIKSLEYEKERELRRLYWREISQEVDETRARFTAAVAQATGWEPHEYAQNLSRWYHFYEDGRVDAEWVGRDFGVPAAEVVEGFKAYDRATPPPGIHPLLSVIQNGGALPVRQYEEISHLVYPALRRRQ